MRLLLAAISFVGALIAAEGYVRFALDRLPGAQDRRLAEAFEQLAEFDPVLGFKYRPNSDLMVASPHDEFSVLYKVNEVGLRDRPLGTHLRKELKILALGDAQLEGWGVNIEDTFIKLAEKQINTRTGLAPPVRIVSAGQSGFGTAQSFLHGKSLIERLSPVAVVLFYTSEMVSADHHFLALAAKDAAGLATGMDSDAPQAPLLPHVEEGETAVPRWLVAAARYSALARVLAEKLAYRNSQAAIKPGDPASDRLAGIRADAAALAELHAPSLHHVRALADAARAAHIPFLLIQLPLPPQVSPREWPEGRRLYQLAVQEYPADDALVVTAFCAHAELSCRAAHSAMRGAAAGMQSTLLYYKYDPVPNVEGHKALGAWLGGELFGWLSQLGLITAP